MSMAQSQSLVEAYTLMRKGALYMIIAAILVGVGAAAVLFTLFGGLAIAPFNPGAGLAAMGSAAIAVVALALVGAIIALIGLWGKFIPGVKRLAEIDKEFSTASTLINIGLFWGFILLLISIPLVFVLIGLALAVVAWILILLGHVGLLILGIKLNEKEKEALYLVAGILFILAIFIGLLDFIAWILMYVALGHSIERASASATAPVAQIPK